MFRQFRDRVGDARGGDSLLPDFDLGASYYRFQSDRGTDYTLVPSKDGYASVLFEAPSGVEIGLLTSPDGTPHAAGWRFSVTVDGELLEGLGFHRTGEVPRPLRQLIGDAIADLNAESQARRQRHRAVIERAGQATPAVASEPTPLDRLRSDFDLGPEDDDFTSARGWDYEYIAATSKDFAAVRFTAPSSSDIFLVFEPQTAGGRREVRVTALVDDVEVSEAPLLTVRQFPEPIQWLMHNAIADLNWESEARAARRRETLDRAGRTRDGDGP